MTKIILTNPSVLINSIDLSDHIASIVLDTKYDIIETTAFGMTNKTRVAGLADNSLQLDFHQDFTGASVEATIYPLLGTATTIVIQPISGTASTSNPKYTFSAVIADWQALNGTPGQLATSKVTWPISGAVTKASS
jgi:hypothetical protein